MKRFGLTAGMICGCAVAVGCQQPPPPQVQSYPQQMPVYQQQPMQPQGAEYQQAPGAVYQEVPGTDYQQVPGGAAGYSPATGTQEMPLHNGEAAVGQQSEYGSR